MDRRIILRALRSSFSSQPPAYFLPNEQGFLPIVLVGSPSTCWLRAPHLPLWDRAFRGKQEAPTNSALACLENPHFVVSLLFLVITESLKPFYNWADRCLHADVSFSWFRQACDLTSLVSVGSLSCTGTFRPGMVMISEFGATNKSFLPQALRLVWSGSASIAPSFILVIYCISFESFATLDRWRCPKPKASCFCCFLGVCHEIRFLSTVYFLNRIWFKLISPNRPAHRNKVILALHPETVPSSATSEPAFTTFCPILWKRPGINTASHILAVWVKLCLVSVSALITP